MNRKIVSIVIPTLNRPEHLNKALHSLLTQSRLPDEVIIVDQSQGSETENSITREHPIFSAKGIALKYIRETRESAAHARNVGWRVARGTIVFFVDDDMVLDRNYISEILRVYHEHPNAVGVQGTWSGWPYWKGTSSISILLNCIRKVFLVTHWEKDNQKILRSGGIVVPYPLTKTIEAEIIYPGLPSFKKAIGEDFCFDENLKGYSWGEEFSTIKLNRCYPHSLYVTPFAKAIHDRASVGRPQEKKLYYIMTGYELYNFDKNVKLLYGSSLKNWIAFLWKTVGQIVILLQGLHHKEHRIRLFYTLQSYLWALFHFGEIKVGKFS